MFQRATVHFDKGIFAGFLCVRDDAHDYLF